MTSRKSGQRNRKRQHLLETLESRQMLAGPQLIGIQPNEGDLIVDGSIRNVAPRSLTFRFDEVQQIDPSTFDGIEITRSGADRTFGTTDDVVIAPGLVTLGDIRQNEVVVRFAENLPDDNYRIDLFAFDDPDRGIVALRNTAGEIIQPSTPGARTETVNFQLNLGALVEAIVPQPVVRQADGSLRQFRNEILVYFNEDTLFVENDPATGQPTARSAENPRFYQLLLTQESVRTTDDVLYFPDRVIYDAATNTSRLIFANDINNLPGVPLGGGTFRLRVGTAVGTRSDLILPPTNFAIAPSVTSDLRIDPDLAVTFRSKVIGEAASGRTISFVNTGAGGLSVSVTTGGNIVFNLGGSTPTVANLASIVAATPAVNAVLSVTFALDGVQGNGGNLVVPANIVSAPPLVMTAVGDTITSSLDVGTFGLAGQSVTSLTLRESIDPRPFLIELPGGTDDPGRLEIPEFSGNGLLQTINENFGADTTDGITEIPYNFKDVFESFGGVSQLNQVGTNELYKTRIREALSLWANYIGVQFRETTDSGITFAFGDPATLRPRPNTQLTNLGVLNASLRIDPTFANSAMVFSNQATFGTAYGQDLFRKAMAGIGFLLGLEGTTDLTAQSLMSLNPGYLNATINPINLDGSTNYGQLTDLEPSFPGNYDILHGRYVHRTDSIDVDMYRFEVNLGAGQRVGTLTAETFAERLADSSLLDTTLTLFRDVPASVVTDFGIGTTLAVQITSVQPGALGNSANISYLRTDRAAGDTAIRIRRALDDNGQPTANGIVIDVPRQSANVTTVTADDVIDAINNDPFASTLFHAEILRGEGSANIIGSALTNSLSLSGGGIEQVSRNDDYFSEDSLLRVTLSNGVYYLGVAASGNNTYDPTIPGSGFGGLTQGKYELLLKFEPQVNESDTLRDLDSARVGVPGTAIDGDGDGVPGGANNFWFQTRPLDRTIAVTGNGAAITPRQTFTITGANGQVRRFEFVPQVGTNFGTPSPGFIAINYNPGASGGGTGSPTPAANIAASIRSAIASVTNETGVRATTSPTSNSVLVLTGERTITFSSNFRGADVLGRTIFVDKTASVTADGSLDNPFNNISNPAVPNAFGATRANDIVRIVGNGGLDNNPSTSVDNFSYRIGTTETGGATLEDGRNMQVPQGVTVMIDAGAAFKLRNSAISVGSTSLTVDRSGGALQVLGTPRLVDLSDPVIVSGTVTNRGIALRPGSGDVVFTSTRDASVDAAASGSANTPAPGNWGGLIFRRDLDQAEGRTDLEDEGIFLQSVNHADIRFGGGANILIDAVQQAVNPIQLINLRPNITFNTISNSANAAMSAAPDSFEETSYQAPRFQAAGAFTADYDRVGPEINNNLLVNNSINGLFVRVETSTTTAPRQLTVAGRFDDIDIVHYIADNIVVAGTPGGSLQDGVVPDVSSISAQVLAGGSLAAGTYNYRITFVDAFGFESLGSLPTADITVPAGSSINLITLPQVDDDLDYLFRRVYRRDLDGVYRVAGQLDASDNQFIDDGSRSGSPLNLARLGVRGRLDGSLVVDPGSVLKFRGARIELGQGTQLLAEGTASKPIVFTSSLDDRFGAGGSFDTNNDINTPNGAASPARGDWSGIYAGPTANVSFDFSTIAYGGGVSLIEGGQSRGFDALELHQATARVTNSRFEFNANGQAGAGPVGRNGRLGVTPATIFARFTQPIIVGNTFVDNRGSIIDLDSDSFGDNFLVDIGRQTGLVERLSDLDDNQGPLIRRNVTDSVATDTASAQQLNGLKVRGGILSTGSVWDDTDIVHVLNDTIIVGNLISNSGLRLKSRPDEGLVVKLSGAGTPNSPTIGTGFTATGSTSNISDRIGGTVQVIGLPGAPVVLTSIFDDTVGAGRRIDGTQQTDTNGDSFGTRPSPNDWRSLLFDQFSNDRNVAVILEQEASTAVAPGQNGTKDNAQVLGELAERPSGSNDTLRLGFEVQGYLSSPTDIDVYGFIGTAGTPVWIDIDRTTFSLDTVIEVLDAAGNVVARVDNSLAEVDDPSQITVVNPQLASNIGSLQGTAEPLTQRGAGGLYEDFGTVNPRDAGLRMSLPGVPGSTSPYFFRVRSASINPADPQGGLTRGNYSFQVRLQEAQEFPGSVVQFADIRYANNGIHVRGLPGSSPLLGETQENESVALGTQNSASNDLIDNAAALFSDTTPTGQRPQFVGNLANASNGTFSIGGSLASSADVDFYQFDVDFAGALGQLQKSTVFDIDYADGFSRPDTNISVFYDDDFETGTNPPRLILFGQSSNIFEDQTSPLGADIGEILARGSVSNGDPFIGPVSLPEGSYYVAITSSTNVPAELSANPLVRREPINSIQRIFEDRVTAGPSSTAAGPLFPQMFTDASITAGGFEKTTARQDDAGHGIPQPFDNSVAGVNFIDVLVPEIETGNLPPGMNLDANGVWTIADNPNIGGDSFFNIAPNTSTSIPHTSIVGGLFNELADFFTITVPVDGTRVIVDLDEGFNPFLTNPGTGTVVTDPNSADFDLVLLRPNPNGNGLQFVPGVGTVTTSSVNDGRGGSVSTLDPFFDTLLGAGVYFIGVIKNTTTVAIDNTTGAVTVTGPNTNDGRYVLHVSVEDHVLNSVGGGNESIHFNRQTATGDGTLVSEPFDLTGYAAADEPVFYYNYLYLPEAGDNVTVTVTSDQTPTGVTVASPQANSSTWLQSRISLRDFAGQTNVRVTFDYQISGAAAQGEGLYLDDFVVGFAERGEMVAYARGGEDDFTGAFAGVSGEYQLELRPGTEYATPANRLIGGNFVPGVNLNQTFDTNDRQAQQITIVAPAGDQLADGDRFTLGDGLNSIVFEFSTDASVGFGNVRIPFTSTDSAAVIAGRLITAINQPSTQATLNVEAATASGIASGAASDARVALSGPATGNFLPIANVGAAPAPGTRVTVASDGSIQLPAIFHDGIGDFNKVRSQGQFIIDSNRISDARAIGIWSEPGSRDIDAEDRRQDPRFQTTNPFVTSTAVTQQNPFLQQPPVGNTYPGAIINLPTLNDSVLGGLASGVVVVNNIVDQAGFAGIKVDGETRPFVLEGATTSSAFGSFQTFIADGHTMAIDASGTRVVFEFEDISGAPVIAGGSGVVGGDGFADGHVPIYYRLDSPSTYNPSNPTPNRNYAHSNLELMLSIMQSIQGSILVTNGLSELVTPTIGPSLTRRDELVERSQFRPEGFPTAALYLQGVANIYFSSAFQKVGGGSQLQAIVAPVSEAPQPVARVVNNTIYGADGREVAFSTPGTSEPNDNIGGAVDTKAGRAHRKTYTSTAQIGDNAGPLSPDQDVDFYKVELVAGDRLVVDIDTAGGGPDTALRLFDSRGVAQSFTDTVGTVRTVSENDTAPDYLDPASTVATPVPDAANARDGFIDFTATETGTYYIAVSSSGNSDYDPLSLSGRTAGTGGVGGYTIGVEVYAPRTFVMSVDDQNEARNGSNTGTRGSDLIGTTFTITQIPDYVGIGAYVGVTPVGNQVTFEFTGASGIVTGGNIAVPLLDDYRVPDIARAISNAINGFANNPALNNHESQNGPNGRSGPVRRVEANALGGIDGDNGGIANLSRNNIPLHYALPTGSDFQRGFGHNRLENSANNAQVVPGGNNFTDGAGTTELYVLVERAARIDISPQAAAAGLRLTPDATRPAFSTESDQLLTEIGLLIAGGSSSTVLNNVFVNLHQSLVTEESDIEGFGQRVQVNQFIKPQTVIVTGNTFQYDEPLNTLIRANLTWIFGRDTGITTDAATGPSNVNGAGSDFNFIAGNNADVLENPAGNRFLPGTNSVIIDNAIDSLVDRDAFRALKLSVGIPSNNVIAPSRDNSGLLRADNPFVSNPGGIGENVFKDRGALDRADFVGPTAILEVPRDNDAEGIDTDPAESFVQLSGGVYDEFRILLQDLGDSSDPFVGTGIDDDTVVVPVIPGLRASGAAVALFEGDRLLVEGVDYTFSYDTTKNLITLRPIAGIWRDDRAYRVKLNNRDRLVAVAPAAGQIVDGDTFSVIDSQGGRVSFEYDSGYQLTIPEALTFTVPAAGTGAGGISDGDLFTITGVDGVPVVFEFNRDATKLPGTREVRFDITDTPSMIAASARAAIASAAAAGLVDVDVDTTATGPTVVIGSDAGIVLDASNSGLVTAPRTLALRVPTAGAGPAGVDDGDVLTIHDGNTTVSFEFEIAGGLNNPNNTPISIAGLAQADAVLAAILNAIENSPLRLTPIGIGNNLFLGLPTNGFASVSQGQLTPIGISRTPEDGDTITLTPAAGPAVTLELSRDLDVTPGNIRVDYTRLSTADDIAASIAAALQGLSIPGLDSAAVQANPGGQVSVGGTAGLQLSLNATSTIVSTGQPDVAGSTLLTISGPLLGQLPIVGGNAIPDDSQFTLSDGTTTITFIYNVFLTGVSNLTATEISYRTFETVDQIAANTVAAINTAFNGTITATDLGGGLISFGKIADTQLTFPAAPAIAAPLEVRRGIVSDGERIVITENGQSRTFEFESAVGGGGVQTGAIPVVFQPSGSVTDVANILAASINNNRGSLSVTATVEPGGLVRLADSPQTVTDVSGAPSITLSGRPGGAIAIPFTGSFTAEDIKRSAIDAINRASAAGITTLTAEDRGGSTFFIENAVFVDGPLPNYFLEGIKDVSGQLLKPTAGNGTQTQFTMLLPTVGLDYGDAPDPLGNVRGRYPTLLDVDGPRHVVSDQVRLGTLVDVDSNGLPNAEANGDDTTIFIRGVTGGNFFSPTVQPGFVEVAFNIPVPASDADGNTVTLSTGVDSATFEFDTDGIFDENNFAVSVDASGGVTPAMVAQAFANAIRQSPLRPADVVIVGNTVRVVTDDEDGVSFNSSSNPAGILNRGVPTPISVTVTGGGVLEAWVDFNFDGDFSDPGEQIIDRSTPGAVFSANSTGTPVTRQFTINVPPTAPAPSSTTFTYARFRVSADGGLSPTGLALSGEVEDYRLTILPGLPPDVNDTNRALTYTVDEDGILQARDADGSLTPASSNDNGALAAIQDPDGDAVEVFAEDVGTRTLLDPSGATAGTMTLFDDGTFVFQPTPDFFGNTQFMFRVVDVPASDPTRQIVSPVQVTVNITVDPVNDRPFVSGASPTITRTIQEDAVQTFTTAELTSFYSPGPANESGQALVIQSAGVNGVGFQTELGGTLTLVGGNLVYTPPANIHGGPDRFSYVVADDPNDANQLVQSAATRGTIVINLTSVNDAPTTGTDAFDAEEDATLSIPINGPGGILSNDLPGPTDEVAAGQTLTLDTTDLPKNTARGGRIEVGANGTLLYTPAADFTGQDQFTYRVSDNGSPPATATGVVLINVGGDNDPPVFVGVGGDPTRRSLEFNESKETEQVFDFNLSSWFTDPEGDSSTFTVVSSNESVVRAEVIQNSATGISTLRLTLPSFSFSDRVNLDIVATNVGGGPSATAQVPVKVVNTPDPPTIVGTLEPLSALEDEVITRDLTTVFADPDGATLTYSVTRLGALVNPTAAQIAASPLVEAITFNGDNMTITLDPDASGSVDIEIGASDGSFLVTDNFTLTVTPVADDPRGVADFYNVPIGARFEIIDPSQGIVGNDVDPDSDVFPGTTRKVRVDLASVTQPARGTVTVNADGTFAYTNTGGATGDTDSFTYRPIDATGRLGAVTTVTFNLGRSRYQNPIPGFNFDVTANGVITPLDALRIINRLSRERTSEIPVSELTTPPPDFYDVNGDGFIRPLDALLVINEISRRNRALVTGGEGEGLDARLATTVAYAAPDHTGLSESNRIAPEDAKSAPAEFAAPENNDPFALGMEIIDRRVEQSTEELIQLTQASEPAENTAAVVDEVLSSWFEATNL